MDAFVTQLSHLVSPTLVVLVGLSVLTLAVGLERLAATRRARARLLAGRRAILAHLQAGNLTMAHAVNTTAAWHPATEVLGLLLDRETRPFGVVKRTMHQVLRRAKRRLWVLGSVGSLAPFIGLLGTVIGVMQAFSAMGAEGTGGFQVVSAGLSEALVTTAAGIFVAVEAMLLYNYLQVCLAAYGAELRETIEELLEIAMPRENIGGR